MSVPTPKTPFRETVATIEQTLAQSPSGLLLPDTMFAPFELGQVDPVVAEGYQRALARQGTASAQLARLGLHEAFEHHPEKQVAVNWAAGFYAVTEAYPDELTSIPVSGVRDAGSKLHLSLHTRTEAGHAKWLLTHVQQLPDAMDTLREIAPSILAAWDVQPELIAAFCGNFDSRMQPKDARDFPVFKREERLKIAVGASDNGSVLEATRATPL